MDNADWLDKLGYVDFLRDFGKHFTINKMLTFDSVKIRLEREQSLSFVEFNYMIFQAYDFYELNNRNSCTLQIGGSDQWGNIVNGVELIRRVNGKEVWTLQLLFSLILMVIKWVRQLMEQYGLMMTFYQPTIIGSFGET